MRRGFTIIELLVASMLLGMLVTILTMIFNQSSIAWRVGLNGVSDLGDARYTTGTVREIADNAFVYGNKGYRHIGLWQRNGQLRNRACDADDLTDGARSDLKNVTQWFFSLPTSLAMSDTIKPSDFKPKNVGSGSGSKGFNTYIVNVKCAGPDRRMGTWDDIWSFPDDPNEW